MIINDMWRHCSGWIGLSRRLPWMHVWGQIGLTLGGGQQWTKGYTAECGLLYNELSATWRVLLHRRIHVYRNWKFYINYANGVEMILGTHYRWAAEGLGLCSRKGIKLGNLPRMVILPSNGQSPVIRTRNLHISTVSRHDVGVRKRRDRGIAL